jgi:hypothetical protein
MNQFETIWANEPYWITAVMPALAAFGAGPWSSRSSARVVVDAMTREFVGNGSNLKKTPPNDIWGKCRNNKLTTLCRRLAPNLSFRINFNALGRIARSGPTAETATPRKVRSANRS